jgi:hypothetical protein
VTTRLSASEAAALIGGRRSKYGVDRSEAGKSARTYGGRIFDSVAEMRYCQLLDIRKLAGDIQDFWCQQDIPLVVNGIRVAKLIADFKILHLDNTIEFCDVKGFATPAFRLKLKLLKACHPNLRFTVVPAKEIR